MKALLLAAGLGTRLKPITDIVPKCLVPINGKPLLEYWIDNLVNAGIKEILINTHYKKELVENFVQQNKYRKFITTIYEPTLLATGGTLYKNRDFFQNDNVLMAHADNLCICNFRAFIEAYNLRPKGVELTMMTFTTDIPETCGIVELDKDGMVINFYEKVKNPPSNLANAAVYIMSPKILEFMKSLNKEIIDFSTEVIPQFIGKTNTFHNDVYHRDIGNLESYSLAQIEIRKFNG